MIKQLKHFFSVTLRFCKEGRLKYSSNDYCRGMADAMECIVQCGIRSKDMPGKDVYELQELLNELKVELLWRQRSKLEPTTKLDSECVAGYICQQILSHVVGPDIAVKAKIETATRYCFEHPTLFTTSKVKTEPTEDEVDAVMKSWGCGHRGGDSCYCTDDNIGTCTYVARRQLKSKKDVKL